MVLTLLLFLTRGIIHSMNRVAVRMVEQAWEAIGYRRLK